MNIKALVGSPIDRREVCDHNRSIRGRSCGGNLSTVRKPILQLSCYLEKINLGEDGAEESQTIAELLGSYKIT